MTNGDFSIFKQHEHLKKNSKHSYEHRLPSPLFTHFWKCLPKKQIKTENTGISQRLLLVFCAWASAFNEAKMCLNTVDLLNAAQHDFRVNTVRTPESLYHTGTVSGCTLIKI